MSLLRRVTVVVAYLTTLTFAVSPGLDVPLITKTVVENIRGKVILFIRYFCSLLLLDIFADVFCLLRFMWLAQENIDHLYKKETVLLFWRRIGWFIVFSRNVFMAWNEFSLMTIMSWRYKKLFFYIYLANLISQNGKRWDMYRKEMYIKQTKAKSILDYEAQFITRL